ncbi:WD and tetratricopeptide repeat protein, putative isoform 5 [Hibiscus syriacus]|uniref:WD and tetratricopeptide repeat protein, putative isoform 5 n=1 Tax=Hibiscus syriacus TaxID=106335 RepID=A0A6A2Y9D9_HIBSY|nr:WD and tetratricopeptide repeat protein, putative isoform 5 [Hibiscus syriacus]
MEEWPFHDGNVHNLLKNRHIDTGHDVGHSLQMHSSLIHRLSIEQELEGHQGCVNDVAWNSNGSLLISGSDDKRINIWSYCGWKLLHSLGTGHDSNIFCKKFIPETSDELVVSRAGDAEVILLLHVFLLIRLFNLSCLNGRGLNDGAITPSALHQCHARRVKKLAVEVGNPDMVWSASEDGTLRQHDSRGHFLSSSWIFSPRMSQCSRMVAGTDLPAWTIDSGALDHMTGNKGLFQTFQTTSSLSSLDLRGGEKRSLVDNPRHTLALKSCDISSTRPHLLLVGGSDAFARLYDRRMLPLLTSCQKRMLPPTCVYFCPMHLSGHGRSRLHLTHVTFSPNREEVLLIYGREHVYLMDINHASGRLMHYT